MIESDDQFAAGFHGLPGPNELSQMSFLELAELLSSCEKDTPRFLVVERELKKRLAKDQAKIILPNMLWAAALAGVFAILGAVVGATIRGLPSTGPTISGPAQLASPPAHVAPALPAAEIK